MKGKLFLSLFALPFAAVGVWMMWSVGSSCYDAWRMDDWVRVDAVLLDAGYESHSGDDADTYEAYARFTYDFRGRTYTGSRVAISSGADNIGDYQRDLGRRLESSRAAGRRVAVFVNPDRPAEAIVDRKLRWGLIGFKAIFVVVFGGVGLGLLYAAWRSAANAGRTPAASADEPWLRNDDWQTATVRSSSKSTMWSAWIFAGFWNAISAPLPFIMVGEIVDKGNWIGLLALLFPLIGIGLAIWAIRRTLEWHRFGPAPVVLDPFPGSIGGHVGGTMDLRLPFDPAARFRVTLTNLHSRMSGSGKNRSRRETAKWQDSTVAYAEPGGKGTRLTFRFDVPEGLHESDADRGDSYYLWRLGLEAELPGADLDRSYDIPVYATARHSRHLSGHAVETAYREHSAIVDRDALSRVHLDTGASGKRMYFPMGRNVGASMVGLLVGVTFAGAGWFLVVSAGRPLFGSVFGGIGALVAAFGVYAMGNSLEVRQESLGLRVTRRLFGLPIRRQSLSFDDIVELRKHSNFQAQSGGKSVMYYTVRAVDHSGRQVVVGEGFRGESEADAAIRLIRREFGLRPPASPGRTGDGDGLLGPEVLG